MGASSPGARGARGLNTVRTEPHAGAHPLLEKKIDMLCMRYARIPCDRLRMRAVYGVLCCHRGPFAHPVRSWRLGRAIPVLGLDPALTPLAPGRLVAVRDECGHCGGIARADGVAAQVIIHSPPMRETMGARDKAEARRHSPLNNLIHHGPARRDRRSSATSRSATSRRARSWPNSSRTLPNSRCVRSRWSTSGATNCSTITCTAADWTVVSARLARLAPRARLAWLFIVPVCPVLLVSLSRASRRPIHSSSAARLIRYSEPRGPFTRQDGKCPASPGRAFRARLIVRSETSACAAASSTASPASLDRPVPICPVSRLSIMPASVPRPNTTRDAHGRWSLNRLQAPRQCPPGVAGGR